MEEEENICGKTNQEVPAGLQMGAEVEAAGSVVQQVESTLLLVEEGKGGITGGLVDFCLGAIMGTLASLNLKEEQAWGIRSLVENLF